MKEKKNKKQSGSKPIHDLTSYLNPEMLKYDVDGSYTGYPSDLYFYGDEDDPVQDADDL